MCRRKCFQWTKLFKIFENKTNTNGWFLTIDILSSPIEQSSNVSLVSISPILFRRYFFNPARNFRFLFVLSSLRVATLPSTTRRRAGHDIFFFEIFKYLLVKDNVSQMLSFTNYFAVLSFIIYIYLFRLFILFITWNRKAHRIGPSFRTGNRLFTHTGRGCGEVVATSR